MKSRGIWDSVQGNKKRSMETKESAEAENNRDSLKLPSSSASLLSWLTRFHRTRNRFRRFPWHPLRFPIMMQFCRNIVPPLAGRPLRPFRSSRPATGTFRRPFSWPPPSHVFHSHVFCINISSTPIDHRKSFDYPGTIAVPIQPPYVETLYPGGSPLNHQQYMARQAELDRRQFQRELEMSFLFSTLFAFCCCFAFWSSNCICIDMK